MSVLSEWLDLPAAEVDALSQAGILLRDEELLD